MGVSILPIEKIKGILLTPLRRIPDSRGEVMHAMKISDPGFHAFGEAYFSVVFSGQRKGWKKHHEMTLNLVVPAGRISFTAFDDRTDSETQGFCGRVELSPDHYYRLTVPPGLWLAFEGLDTGLNLLLNLADRLHDPAEATNKALDSDDMPDVWED